MEINFYILYLDLAILIPYARIVFQNLLVIKESSPSFYLLKSITLLFIGSRSNVLIIMLSKSKLFKIVEIRCRRKLNLE